MKGTLENWLISVVDDDNSIHEATASLLSSVGFKVKTFAATEELLGSIFLQDTSCLILDICMPGLSGLDLQRQLVTQQHPIPIIFITAHGNRELEAQARRHGAVDFLRKPYSASELFRAIRTILNTPEINEWVE